MDLHIYKRMKWVDRSCATYCLSDLIRTGKCLPFPALCEATGDCRGALMQKQFNVHASRAIRETALSCRRDERLPVDKGKNSVKLRFVEKSRVLEFISEIVGGLSSYKGLPHAQFRRQVS